MFVQEKQCFLYVRDRQTFNRKPGQSGFYFVSIVEHAVYFLQRGLDATRMLSNVNNHSEKPSIRVFYQVQA